MGAGSLVGGFASPASMSARAFRAAMEAMARPGRIQRIAGAAPPAPLSPAAGALLLTLCDGSTPLHLAGDADSPEVRAWVAFHCGAPLASAQAASFALGAWDALRPLDRFATGTPEYPDRSATLIVEVPDLQPEGARLAGPGIETEARLSLPEGLAEARAAVLAYPLGLDLFLTAGERLAALPRSTRVL